MLRSRTRGSFGLGFAAALGMTLGGFAMSASPAKAADLGGDCCADLEERVAELEATTVRKGNKKVSVTLSGWVVKTGIWWDDGHEQNFYVGDKDSNLTSHFQLSGSAQISPGWSAGYTVVVEVPGTSCALGYVENQFNDNACLFGDISVPLSYMWVKSDKYGTINWGELSQATDNVALLPDLSGTLIEANGVLFEGAGMFIRPKGAKNSNDLTKDFTWGGVFNCLTGGGGTGADCNGYLANAVRYDTPTWAGFSASTSYGEDDMWDVAVKYAADWNSVKFSAAAGWTQTTDEGCNNPAKPGNAGGCTNAWFFGGGGLPNQNYRKDVGLFQAGASVMHVPSGLWAYGMYQNEQNDGTQYKNFNFNTGKISNSAANETDVWYVKAGIKKAWTPLGATVLFGEWGQYNDMFTGICGLPGDSPNGSFGNAFCAANLPIGVVQSGPNKGQAVTTPALITGSEVNRWGLGVVQEIDSAAMHVFARWQRLEANVSAQDNQFCKLGVQSGAQCGTFFTFDKDRTGAGGVPGDDFVGFTADGKVNKHFGKNLNSSFQDLDIFQVGGVIFF